MVSICKLKEDVDIFSFSGRVGWISGGFWELFPKMGHWQKEQAPQPSFDKLRTGSSEKGRHIDLLSERPVSVYNVLPKNF